MTVNTACSSSLVAVDLALRDAKAGRIDFAIVGGINLFGDDMLLFEELRIPGMLSPTARCHTFSTKADGYVRGEGGVLFLLHAGDKFPSHARILGSGLTQNSTQRPLTAVDPKAQERAIWMACADAGIEPSHLAAVEMHGTGTPLGDPVEISALARAVRKKDGQHSCVVTAAKMHVGHLESAAGAVGLLKAVMMCQKHRVPGFEVDGGLSPEVVAAMQGASFAPVGKPAVLEEEGLVGISSFGFGGSNAHVVVAATPKQRSLPGYELPLRYHKVFGGQ
jgi:acyl transferase domain-containing protein